MKITSINNDGQIITREYDNRKCKFTVNNQEIVIKVPDEFFVNNAMKSIMGNCTNNGYVAETTNTKNNNSGPFKLQNDIKETQENKEKYFGNVSSRTKNSNLSTLKIQLGLGCNFSCSYCKQAIHADKAEATNMQDLNKFIETFDDWCTAPKDERIKIELWGGEPLVYFVKIKKLVEFLESRFDNIHFGMVTNGSLLTIPIVDYLLEHNIGISVSYDGPMTTLHRDSDPLAEGSTSLEAIKYYTTKSKNILYLNAVLTKNNINPKSLYESAKGALGDAKFLVGFEGMADVENEDQCDSSDNLFNEDDYKVLRGTIKEQLLKGELELIQPFGSKMRALVRSWCNSTEMIFDNTLQKCGMDNPHIMAVNLRGEALVCHSSDDVIGHVSDFENISLNNSKVGHWNQKEECRSCPVLNLCRGSCMNIRGNEWYYTCNNEFHYNMAIFEAAYELIFDETILSIDDVIRPTKPVEKKIFKLKVVSA